MVNIVLWNTELWHMCYAPAASTTGTPFAYDQEQSQVGSRHTYAACLVSDSSDLAN